VQPVTIYYRRVKLHGCLHDIAGGGLGVVSLAEYTLPIGKRVFLQLPEYLDSVPLFVDATIQHSAGTRHGFRFVEEASIFQVA